MNSCGADLIPHHFAVEVETRSTVAIFMGLMLKCVVWPTIDGTMTTRKYFHPRQYCGFSSLPSPLYLLPQCVCTCIRGWLPVFWCDVCVASIPWHFCVWGATLTKQTCGGGMFDGTPVHPLNPILCLQEKSNRLRCYLMENLISGCGGKGRNAAQLDWGAPTTHGEDSGSDNRAGTPSATAHQFLYFIFEKLDFIL